MTSNEIIALIDYQSNEIMSRIINNIIEDHDKTSTKMRELYEKYDGDAEILHRTKPLNTPEYKADNKIPNDFPGMIVDQGTAYFAGKEIVIELDDTMKNDTQVVAALNEFKKMNQTDDLDLESATYAGICGVAARLLYIDKAGKERVMNLMPWEVVFIYNKTTNQLEYAMVYYKIELINTNTKQKQKVYRIEWYDKTNVRYYIESPLKRGFYKLDDDEPVNPQPHGFNEVPLIEILNNDNKKGDFQKVLELIAGYDRLFSDAQNELEDFRNAYMVFKGVNPDDKTMQAAQKTGAFGSDDEDFDVSFLTKDLQGTFLENHKKTTVENIFKYSKRVDMNDEKFSGATQTGENRKWKLLQLEHDAVIKERKFRKALNTMFRILEYSWKRKNINFNYLGLSYQFTRNLPVDLQYYGQIISNLFGKIPLETLYSILPFVEDVQDEIKKYEARYGKGGGINLDNIPDNTGGGDAGQ